MVKVSLPDLLKELSAEQHASLVQYEELMQSAALSISPEILREHPKRFALRFLRADDYDVKAALERLKFYIEASAQFKFGGVAEDSFQYRYDQNGPMWPCGFDKHGNYTVVMRPCTHLPKNTNDSDLAVLKILNTMRLCGDCLPPGHERLSVIYDASNINPRKNWDLRFVKGLAKYLGTCFPERIGRIFVVNNGVVIQSLWKVVKTFLDPVTASKIVFCGTKLEVLNELFEKDHPFIMYLHARKKLKGKAKDTVKLPNVSPYEPTWERAVAEDAKDLDSRIGTADNGASPEAVKVECASQFEPRGGNEDKRSAEHLKTAVNQPSDSTEIIKDETFLKEESAQSNNQEQPDDSFDATAAGREGYDLKELVEITRQLRAAVEVKERTYHLRKYPPSFLGSEAVDALISLGHARTIEEAEALGDLIIAEKLFAHVANDHGLKNQYLFYRFSEDNISAAEDPTSWSQMSASGVEAEGE